MLAYIAIAVGPIIALATIAAPIWIGLKVEREGQRSFEGKS